MLPDIVDESQINRFSYWDKKVCQGMLYRGELYRYLSSYSKEERMGLFLFSMKLSKEGFTICITASEEGYCLWLGLRVPRSTRVMYTPQDHYFKEESIKFRYSLKLEHSNSR